MSNPHAHKAAIVIFLILFLMGCGEDKKEKPFESKENIDYRMLCEDITVVHFGNKLKRAEEYHIKQTDARNKCLELKKSLSPEQEQYYSCPEVDKFYVPNFFLIKNTCLEFFLGYRNRGMYY